MSTEYISGQGGLFQVLTSEEMLESDVAAARDDRRVAEGFVSPADARAFLELVRRGEEGDEPDAITRAYFRGMEVTTRAAEMAPQIDEPRKRGAGGTARNRSTQLTAAADVNDLVALLREADVIAPPAARLAALTEGLDERLPVERDSKPEQTHLAAPLFEQAMSDLQQRDPALFSARVREVGYLVNVWIAGGAHERRRPRPAEALEMVLKTCETGIRTRLAAGRVDSEQALTVLMRTSAVTLFRRGFRGAGGAWSRGPSGSAPR